MDQDLAQLEAFAQGLIENLSSAARKSLARKIAIDLRASQAQRIADQRNPDGSKFEARKPQMRLKKGRIRRAMFAKIRLNSHLKYKSTDHNAEVSFNRKSERIAKVHQFGLRDRVSRIRTLTVQYPIRQLLGFSNADKDHIKDTVIDHLAI